MPDDGTRDDRVPIEGLSGGPGPTPPGFDDGTPQLVPPRPPGEDPGAAEAPQREARGEGERRGAARGDPEEPDPS